MHVMIAVGSTTELAWRSPGLAPFQRATLLPVTLTPCCGPTFNATHRQDDLFSEMTGSGNYN